MKRVERSLVIVVGSAEFDKAPFANRNLSLQSQRLLGAQKQFRYARALLVAEPPGRVSRIAQYFKTLLLPAESHGLIIRVLVHSEDEAAIIRALARVQGDGGGGSSVDVFYGQSLAQIEEVAETIARTYISPLQAAEAAIDTGGEKLSREEIILLRRAFFDSPKLRLQRLHGGKVAAGVFRVHAWCSGALPLQRPLPFFVKFAPPKVLEMERQNYREWVEPYIPFHLRPNLDRRRCVTGSTLSALVGNLVEDAIPLRDGLRRGLASGTLFGLFEVTLKGLRAQPFTNQTGKRSAGLEEFAKKCVSKQRFESCGVIVSAARELGLNSDPQELEGELCEQAKDIPHWWAPTHGDLHSGNVMVRRGDAIVIDFGRTGYTRGAGPLTADPATLEVSLVFGTDNDDDHDFDRWKTFTDRAYDCLPLVRPPNPEAEPSTLSWLHNAVREIRHILFGCDCSDSEAAIVLASYLMRYARLDVEELKSSRRKNLAFQKHAYALVMAERVISNLFKLRQNNRSQSC